MIPSLRGVDETIFLKVYTIILCKNLIYPYEFRFWWLNLIYLFSDLLMQKILHCDGLIMWPSLTTSWLIDDLLNICSKSLNGSIVPPAQIVRRLDEIIFYNSSEYKQKSLKLMLLTFFYPFYWFAFTNTTIFYSDSR